MEEVIVSVSGPKSVREVMEELQECARELVEEVGPILGRSKVGAVTVLERMGEGLPLSFVIGVGSTLPHEVKKMMQKEAKGGASNCVQKMQGPKGEKRKECMVDDCDDGFDVLIGKADVMENKLKIDDTCDGNVMSLRVAEIGVNQPLRRTMKTLSWNCQGLGNPRIVKTLQPWCWRESASIVFLMEAKIDSKKLQLIMEKYGSVDGLCLISRGLSRGLGLWW